MSNKNKILDIINQAQRDLSREKLSIILNDCLRIAILRNDFANQWWINWEFCTMNDSESMRKYPLTVQHRFTKENFELLWKKYQHEWFNEREISADDLKILNQPKGTVYALSVIELENKIDYSKAAIDRLVTPQGLAALDAYSIEIQNFKARHLLETASIVYQNIIGKIKTRAAAFLNQTEYELSTGRAYSDIFMRTKEFVDEKLSEIAPDVLQKFISINLDTNNAESFAQSLITCRRVLKSFADSIYPPIKTAVSCSDGKQRILDDEKYINRIWQYIYEKVGKTASSELMQNQLDNLGKRVDYIYSLTNKGVHAAVNEQEANQCIIQTYLLIGDVLRIKNNA